ncbi:MAG: hypothetical protein FD153_953 [Rhodospirillaceae bacterium]|nr:MAG: hypothetical protein FD153_953 [Rhodospirillaceae bacterium]
MPCRTQARREEYVDLSNDWKKTGRKNIHFQNGEITPLSTRHCDYPAHSPF